jgi:glyoxylase-like metal-dependent hydrolase (beta-lactamase superfamily II)
VSRVLAPNPGPFTLEGTNTWIVGEGRTAVIDPGPEDEGHLREVAREAGVPEAILLTHRHPDHAAGAAMLSSMSGAPVLAVGPEWIGEALEDGQEVRVGGARLLVVRTPGHSPDHVSFHDPDGGALFTGDAVLGRGTSVIDPPEGDMGDYLRSLDRMIELEPRTLYPGHGPAVWTGRERLLEYRTHRQVRERQVIEALEHERGGPRAPEDLVPRIYADHPHHLFPAAARSVLAHLLKLEREGRVKREASGSGDRFAIASQRR